MIRLQTVSRKELENKDHTNLKRRLLGSSVPTQRTLKRGSMTTNGSTFAELYENKKDASTKSEGK